MSPQFGTGCLLARFGLGRWIFLRGIYVIKGAMQMHTHTYAQRPCGVSHAQIMSLRYLRQLGEFLVGLA